MRLPHSHRRPELDPGDIDAVVTAEVALAARLDPDDRAQLLDLTIDLLVTKRWEAVAGSALTDDIVVTIAANAAIPVLGLDLSLYRNVHSIIVLPSSTTSHGRRAGPVGGVVADHPTSIIGEAGPNAAPLAIARDAARADSHRPEGGRNVVIHEFAHKIDMADGYSDGTPPLRGVRLSSWTEVLADEYERADARPSDAVLRPYAWNSAAEFFAVATEAFFCAPGGLRDAKPRLYEALCDFYRRDPAESWTP